MPDIYVRGHVVAKGRPRFVRKTGHIYTPDATVEAERAIAAAWISAEVPLVPRPEAIVLRVTVRIQRPKIHFRANGELKPNAPKNPTTKPDLDNLVKTVKDALNGVAWEDDSQVVGVMAWKTYGSPGWRIGITTVPFQTELEEI